MRPVRHFAMGLPGTAWHLHRDGTLEPAPVDLVIESADGYRTGWS